MLKHFLIVVSLAAPASLAAGEPPITAATFAPDGQAVVVGSQRGIALYSWPALRKLRDVETRLGNVHDLAFSRDGTRFAAVGGQPAESGAIELFAGPSLQLLQRRSIGGDLLYQVSWRPDGESMLVAGPDQAVWLLNGDADLQQEITGHSRAVTSIAFLPGGYFVSASRDQTLRVWKQPTRQLVRTLNNHTNEVNDLALRPGSNEIPYVLASASEDRTVRLRWPVRGRLMRFVKLPSAALDIDWLPDGSAILAACADGHLRVIDPESVTVTHDIGVMESWLFTVVASPNGTQAFVGGSGGAMNAVEFSQE